VLVYMLTLPLGLGCGPKGSSARSEDTRVTSDLKTLAGQATILGLSARSALRCFHAVSCWFALLARTWVRLDPPPSRAGSSGPRGEAGRGAGRGHSQAKYHDSGPRPYLLAYSPHTCMMRHERKRDALRSARQAGGVRPVVENRGFFLSLSRCGVSDGSCETQ